MTTPRKFEEQIAQAVTESKSTAEATARCIRVMVETLDSLGYSKGTEVFKEYMESTK